MTRLRPAGLGAACLGGALLAMALPVRAENPFVSLGGSWSGSGQITLDSGKTESIRCRGYYNNKGSDQLGLAIRCASASNKIEMRADLNYTAGSVSGTWEERILGWPFAASSVSVAATTVDAAVISSIPRSSWAVFANDAISRS